MRMVCKEVRQPVVYIIWEVKLGEFLKQSSVADSVECLREVRIQGLPKFLGTPYYLRNGISYLFQIWQVHSEGPSS